MVKSTIPKVPEMIPIKYNNVKIATNDKRINLSAIPIFF